MAIPTLITQQTKTDRSPMPINQGDRISNLQTAPRAPLTGEQIKGRVISGGSGAGISTNFNLSVTVGQTAIGSGVSTSFKVSQGFWHNIASYCCFGKRGNVNCAGVIDLGDLSALVSYLTGGGFVLCCPDAANVNGLGVVDLGDLSALVSYLTGGGFVLPGCP